MSHYGISKYYIRLYKTPRPIACINMFAIRNKNKKQRKHRFIYYLYSVRKYYMSIVIKNKLNTVYSL